MKDCPAMLDYVMQHITTAGISNSMEVFRDALFYKDFAPMALIPERRFLNAGS